MVGIHCYLGIHVLKREVIFVDLSLAQVAALGSVVALASGVPTHSASSYFISLLHTFLVAALFAWARKAERHISQEVLIGIVYAFSSAMVVLIVNNLSHGAEHIKEILVGNILWVSWREVGITALIYLGVAVIHYYFRYQLLAVSMQQKIDNMARWDFLFFALFGVVITSSVGVAGILLVFSFLIVPALLSRFFVSTIKAQLFLGWGIGIAVSLLGMFLSYKLDLPAGALLVTLFTILPILLLPWLRIKA